MQARHVILTLAIILALSCAVLGVILAGVVRAGSTLPDSAVKDLVNTLGESGILVEPSLVSGKRETASVYVMDSADYAPTVASLLAGSAPARIYAVPDGEILLMENGARLDFLADFSFRYSADGEPVDTLRAPEQPQPSEALSAARQEHVGKIVSEFLEAGSRSFTEAEGRTVDVRCVTDAVWVTDGTEYALCSRTVDGIRIAANRVICALEGDRVAEAWGVWYFLTPAETYSAQLTDRMNILFSMKKQIGKADPPVSVESVSLCYSLRFLADGEGFCLIPCWQVTTDSMGRFLFNALDGAFYTIN